jgi:hypothetical protein
MADIVQDTVLTLKQIEDIFFTETCKMIGLDPTLQENQNKVRLAWPTAGSPAWKINEDIVFIRITPIDDKMARTQDILYNTNASDYALKSVGYTRVHKIDWTLYGPNSYDNADLIRSKILNNDYLVDFSAYNLYLVPDVPMPVRLPELYNGQWWERSDFSASYNETVIRRSQKPYFVSTNIQLIKSD